MAYNIDNWGFINANSTIPVNFLFNGGEGEGSQWAEGLPQDANCTLITTNSGVTFNANGQFIYQFDLTNLGPNGTRFGLHGGGQS